VWRSRGVATQGWGETGVWQKRGVAKQGCGETGVWQNVPAGTRHWLNPDTVQYH